MQPAEVDDFWFATENRNCWYRSTKAFDRDRSIALFEQAGLNENLRWARQHRVIVRLFGRFPYPNAAPGRVSSERERTRLDSDGGFTG
jgi:uncharacterized protein (DUF924 family)